MIVKFQLEGHPDALARTLIESPGQWFIVGTALRESNQSLRTFAYRVQAGKHRGFMKQVPEGMAGRWETTVRSEGRESIMYCRFVTDSTD